MSDIANQEAVTTFDGFNSAYAATVGFIVCVRGQMTLRCLGADIILKGGMACFFSPIITLALVSKSDDCRIIRFDLDIKSIINQTLQIINIFPHLRMDTEPFLSLHPEQMSHFLSRFDEISALRNELEQETDSVVQIVLRQNIAVLEQLTIIEVLRLYVRKSSCRADPSSVPQRGLAFRFFLSLAVNFKTHRTVDFYAAEANMSPAYFSRLYKQQTGHTPMESIHTVTISAASDMLARTNLSIKEIAQELGFPEQFTFRKYFKKYRGVSPTEFRESCRGGGVVEPNGPNLCE